MGWLLLGGGAGVAEAAEWFVATNGSDAAAGTNWATAKLTIQAGIDASAPGDTIWVSNGVYATGGGRAVVGSRANRVALDQAVTVRSVDGPETTFIVGAGMRCAYVVNGAVLSGFTLTNGSTASGCDQETTVDHNGGGALCADDGILTNCVLTGNWACHLGGGSSGGVLNNCTLIGNSTWDLGGGSSGGTLNHCSLINNNAITGGGANGGTLNDCTLASNMTSYGGGASGSTLNRCLIQDNYGGSEGGGVFGGTLNRCVLSGNRSMKGGGAARDAILDNCLLTANVSTEDAPGMRGGGGAHGCALNNCTVASNTAVEGGGVLNCTIVNSIVWGNSASESTNWGGGTFTNSCTTPAPGGTGNVTNDPQFVDAAAGNYRLGTNSPCIDEGDDNYVQGTMDLAGDPRTAMVRVDMGAYEVQSLGGYVDWAAAITNGLTNATDCAAGDSVPNLMKYAVGSPDPMEPDDLARLGLMGGGAPALTFNRNPNATDIMLLIQGADAASNGAAWRGVATNVGGSWLGATNVEESGSGNPVECTVTDPVALDSNRFLRLKVSRP